MDNAIARNILLEAERQIANMSQLEANVRHYFADGLYAREITLDAGTVLTGKIHLTRHLCTISKGRIAIQSEQGGGLFEAPFTFISEPGIKRIGYAVEDTVFTTYHPANTTDIAELERQLVCDTYEEYEALTYEKQRALT